MVERRVLGRQGHPKLEFRAFDLAFADDALDLPLRGDADDLEEFAQSDVEAILVLCDPPKSSRGKGWSRMIADAGKGEYCDRAVRAGLQAAQQTRQLAATGSWGIKLIKEIL